MNMDCETPKRSSGKRQKKRKFHGNRFTTPDKQSIFVSASARKLNSSCFENVTADSKFKGYRILDIEILFSNIFKYLCCKQCGSDVQVCENNTNGLSSKFFLLCDTCGELTSFYSSSMMGDKKNIPEINERFMYGMRCISQGLAGMRTFCGVMDLPPPIQKSAYCRKLRKMLSTTSKVAEMSMSYAAEQEIEATGCSDLTVSGDGSWKTRGHSSRVGFASVIGAETGKILDIEVLSSYCKGCESWKGPKYGAQYLLWKANHEQKCIKNHEGSAGKMEVDGICKIFNRSIEKHSVQYVSYIGDGDTKTFSELQKNHNYGSDIVLKKIECVGHVQKRMGNRLRQLKINMRGKQLADHKPLSGKGRLTDKVIDQITTYYGNAIRSNKGSCMDMRKAVWAIFYHKRSTDDEPLHEFCPQGENSWCAFQRAKAAGSEKGFQHKNSMPAAVMDCIKPIFKDLSDPKLLKRCLGAKTQNSNESFNSLVWKLCPKTSGSSKLIAQLAAYEAIISFNDGRIGRLECIKRMGFRVGQYAIESAKKADKSRIFYAEISSSAMSLESRRAKRMANSVKFETQKEIEGILYEAGKF